VAGVGHVGPRALLAAGTAAASQAGHRSWSLLLAWCYWLAWVMMCGLCQLLLLSSACDALLASTASRLHQKALLRALGWPPGGLGSCFHLCCCWQLLLWFEWI
jgi:hypothetical protein